MDNSFANFRPISLLKSDHFSSVTYGFWRTEQGEVEAVLRRYDNVPLWTRPIARFFARNEIRTLECLREADVGPILLGRGKGFLVRSWVDGLPLQVAQPKGNIEFFKQAKKMMRRMHKAGVAHNDLAKQQNWLFDKNGAPRVTDFQLAGVSKKRGKLFRLAAREDLRHLLKHKRNYCSEALTASERRMLEQKSLPSRIWMSTVKPIYNFVTRKVIGYMDREGVGIDVTQDAPKILARLLEHPQISAASVLPYQTPRGARLYAFIESGVNFDKDEIKAFLQQRELPMPNLLQIIERLPRFEDGSVREDVLRLVAQNQVDLIKSLSLKAEDFALAAKISDARLNRTDRFLRNK